MPTTDISNAHVFPEDTGTDVSTDYEQPSSAGLFGGLARQSALLDYVEAGLGFAVASGEDTVDISSGLAFLLVDSSIDVQLDVGGDYTGTWRSGMGLAVDVPEVTGLSLTSGDINHIFLAVDMAVGNGAQYVINTTNTQPADPYLKIGEIDTSTSPPTVTTLNREIGFISESRLDDLEATLSSDINDVDTALTSHENDTANPHNVTAAQTGAERNGAVAAHESSGGHDQLRGGVVGRTDPITNLAGNTWHLAVGESLPAAVEEGDTVVRYEP